MDEFTKERLVLSALQLKEKINAYPESHPKQSAWQAKLSAILVRLDEAGLIKRK